VSGVRHAVDGVLSHGWGVATLALQFNWASNRADRLGDEHGPPSRRSIVARVPCRSHGLPERRRGFRRAGHRLGHPKERTLGDGYRFAARRGLDPSWWTPTLWGLRCPTWKKASGRSGLVGASRPSSPKSAPQGAPGQGLRAAKQHRESGGRRAATPSLPGGSYCPKVDRARPHVPAWFTPRGRPIGLTASVCYHRAGGGP